MMVMEIIFWISLLLIFYAYFGYPITLMILNSLRGGREIAVISDDPIYPTVSVLIPVHNEQSIIEEKIKNCLSIVYPENKLSFLFISDGSTDDTNAIIRQYTGDQLHLEALPGRGGKAAALNRGMEKSDGEIVIFSDASILLEPEVVKNIVQPFKNPEIGCVSGEDHIRESGGEGIYGRYELFLRNQESTFYSIVGASGSFYAQKRELCDPFPEGLAPDFLSVLNTVEKGYKCVTEPNAIGYMTSLKSSKDEFRRKVRTLIRGMSALFYKKHLLNPFRYFRFSFELVSHKLLRWLVPCFMLTALISNVFLIRDPFYQVMLVFNLLFYFLALLAGLRIRPFDRLLPGKIALYFSLVNWSILVAWFHYFNGTRQELWSPSKRN